MILTPYRPTPDQIRRDIRCIGIAHDSPEHCSSPLRKKLEMMYYELEWFIPTTTVVTGTLRTNNHYLVLQEMERL